MRCRLAIHVDAVARMRALGGGLRPDPTDAALAAERGGADIICIEWSERTARDARTLKEVGGLSFRLRVQATSDGLAAALDARPDAVVFVPDLSDGRSGDALGLDVGQTKEALARALPVLRDAGVDAGVHVVPDVDQVRLAHKLGVDFVELDVRRYAEARLRRERSDALARIRDVAKAARKLGVEVCAGDQLSYADVAPLARIAEVAEVGVGHAVSARALMSGYERAVRDLVDVLRDARVDLIGR